MNIYTDEDQQKNCLHARNKGLLLDFSDGQNALVLQLGITGVAHPVLQCDATVVWLRAQNVDFLGSVFSEGDLWQGISVSLALDDGSVRDGGSDVLEVADLGLDEDVDDDVHFGDAGWVLGVALVLAIVGVLDVADGQDSGVRVDAETAIGEVLACQGLDPRVDRGGFSLGTAVDFIDCALGDFYG